MSRSSIRHRKFRARRASLFSFIRFRLLASRFESRVVFVGILTTFVSLFLPWIHFDNDERLTSFSLDLGYIGWILLILNIILFFIVFSNRKKEALKLNMSLSFSDHFLILAASVFNLLLIFIAYHFVFALAYRGTPDISHDIGFIYSIVGALFTFVWGAVLYHSHKQSVGDVEVITQATDDFKVDNDKTNMQLPF